MQDTNNTYKVKATMTIDVEVEVYADSEDDAISKFIQMDARDAIDAGMILDVYTENEKATLSYGTFKVKTKKIDYDVDFNTCWDIVVKENPGIDEDSKEFDDKVYEKIEEIKKSLPQELELEITCEPEDLDYYVCEAVSDETGWLIDNISYEIMN